MPQVLLDRVANRSTKMSPQTLQVLYCLRCDNDLISHSGQIIARFLIGVKGRFAFHARSRAYALLGDRGDRVSRPLGMPSQQELQRKRGQAHTTDCFIYLSPEPSPPLGRGEFVVRTSYPEQQSRWGRAG